MGHAEKHWSPCVSMYICVFVLVGTNRKAIFILTPETRNFHMSVSQFALLFPEVGILIF